MAVLLGFTDSSLVRYAKERYLREHESRLLDNIEPKPRFCSPISEKKRRRKKKSKVFHSCGNLTQPFEVFNCKTLVLYYALRHSYLSLYVAKSNVRERKNFRISASAKRSVEIGCRDPRINQHSVIHKCTHINGFFFFLKTLLLLFFCVHTFILSLPLFC